MGCKQYTGKVLLLGSGNKSFLALIRSFGRKGICVHVGWCQQEIYALKSKYISCAHYIPPFTHADHEWKDTLKRILLKENYDLVIACSDPQIIPLQLYKDELDKIARIYLLDNACYQLANDKFEMQKVAREVGLKVPKEIEITKSTEIDSILTEISFPIVLKPRASFSPDNLFNKKEVEKVYTVNELRHKLEKLKENEALAAQENFIGKGAGVELLASEGEILYAFQHIRIHEPLTGGPSSYRKSVPLNPELLTASEKIIRALNYTGVAMVEFKWNPDSGDWMFIELNARFWGSLPLSIAAGADFPYFLYEMLVTGKNKFPGDYRTGIYCRNMSDDFGWIVSNIRADKSDPTLAALPLWKVALEFFNILLLRERNDTIVIDDVKPGIAEVTDLIKMVVYKIFGKFKAFLVSNSLFRALDSRRILGAIRSANSILFVCKGNICRSPFAYSYLKGKYPSNTGIMSAGYYQKKDRIPPEAAIAAAKRLNVDLATHRSNVINEEIIKKADVIFTFDEENYRTVRSKFPSAKSKTFRISSLNTNAPFEIRDPYNQDDTFYDESYKQIKKVLDSLVLQ